MILYALDQSYNAIGSPIDTWSTAMWYMRYNEEGEMSLYLPASFYLANRDVFKQDNYIENPMFPNTLMIVEAFEMETKYNTGPQVIVTGRSLESILRRRIIWNTITIDNGLLQDAIQRILNENIISPSNSARRIPNFTFKKSADPVITALRVTCNLHGENVYDIIQDWCVKEQIGFRITPQGAGGFEFELYAGIDHSYNQDNRPWVVFSPSYENLSETKNVESSKNLCNAALVYNKRTETVDGNQKEIETAIEVYGKTGSVSGLARRELYHSTGTSNKKDDDTTMTDAQYKAVLQEEGQTQLGQYEIEKVYTGEVDATRQYVLGRDFDLGDVVQFVNEYGIEGSVRIAEIIHSHDDSGDQITPTFINL